MLLKLLLYKNKKIFRYKKRSTMGCNLEAHSSIHASFIQRRGLTKLLRRCYGNASIRKRLNAEIPPKKEETP